MSSILRFNTNIATGDMDTVSATSVTGNSVFLGTSFLKVENLSAYLIVTAATSSITITPHWQVSNDDTTYVTIPAAPNAPANVPIATGAQNRTIAVQAPRGVEGYKYARCMLLVGGATGGATDLFSIGYSYRQNYGG
jgi:hypothetical protein